MRATGLPARNSNSPGTQPGQFQRPYGIDVDAGGDRLPSGLNFVFLRVNDRSELRQRIVVIR